MMYGDFDDNATYSEQFAINMGAKVISPACITCQRFDADTYAKENVKLVNDGDGKTHSVPNGVTNYIQCKYFEECKHIFEDGYKVIKETSEEDNSEKLLQYVAECKQKKMTETEIARSLGTTRDTYRKMIAKAKKEVSK